MKIGEYLEAKQLPQPEKRKTHRYEIVNRSGDELGRVRWYGPWRQYVFHPEIETLFNYQCMIDLAALLKALNKLQRRKRAS